MVSDTYKNYLFEVNGESVAPKPGNLFESEGVYLIIDVNLNTIWIWAGKKSRLFHRYTASSWAVKLKSKKDYYNYKYLVIKQGYEPEEFIPIYNEIVEGRMDLKFPGESRLLKIESKELTKDQMDNMVKDRKITTSEKKKVNKILSEITEIQMHIQYSLEYIGKKIIEIKEILEK